VGGEKEEELALSFRLACSLLGGREGSEEFMM